MTVHPTRYSLTGVQPVKDGVVIHDSETGDRSHDNLISALSQPGTTLLDGSNPPRYIGASYHAITNGQGGYTRILGNEYGPYAAPPLNKTWLHVCMPGRAAQTRIEWLDPLSRAHITGVAQFTVDNYHDNNYAIKYRTVTDLQQGLTGYTSHHNVSLAFGKSTHTDPGNNFPWDILYNDIMYLWSQSEHPTTNGETSMFSTLARYNGWTYAVWSNGTKTLLPTPASIDAFTNMRVIAGLTTPTLNLDGRNDAIPVMIALGPVVGPTGGGRDAWGC